MGGGSGAAGAYQYGGRVQARQLVLRPQHRHPSRRANRYSGGARLAFKRLGSPARALPEGHVTLPGRGFAERGGVLLKETLPPFLRGCSRAGLGLRRCCPWDRPSISRLGERRY